MDGYVVVSTFFISISVIVLGFLYWDDWKRGVFLGKYGRKKPTTRKAG